MALMSSFDRSLFKAIIYGTAMGLKESESNDVAYDMSLIETKNLACFKSLAIISFFFSGNPGINTCIIHHYDIHIITPSARYSSKISVNT